MNGRRIPRSGVSLLHDAFIKMASLRGYVFQKTSPEYHPKDYPKDFRRLYATSAVSPKY